MMFLDLYIKYDQDIEESLLDASYVYATSNGLSNQKPSYIKNDPKKSTGLDGQNKNET